MLELDSKGANKYHSSAAQGSSPGRRAQTPPASLGDSADLPPPRITPQAESPGVPPLVRAHSCFGHVPAFPNGLFSPEGLAAGSWSLASVQAEGGSAGGASPGEGSGSLLPPPPPRKGSPDGSASCPFHRSQAQPNLSPSGISGCLLAPPAPAVRLTAVQLDDLGQAVSANQKVQRDGHGAPFHILQTEARRGGRIHLPALLSVGRAERRRSLFGKACTFPSASSVAAVAFPSHSGLGSRAR